MSLISNSFNDAASNCIDYITSNASVIVNGKLKNMWNWLCPILYLSIMCLEELRKNMKSSVRIAVLSAEIQTRADPVSS
jgi:hypothetical protein